MRTKIKTFFAKEDGAVTVDWFVLTAAVVSIGMGAISATQDAMGTLTGATSEALLTKTINLDD